MAFPVSFNEIDTARQTPGDQVELNDTYAAGLPSKTKNVLLIAPDGSDTPASALVRAVGSVTDVLAAAGVIAARMVDLMLRTHPGISLDLYKIAPPQGAAASVGSVAFASNVDVAGTLHIYCGTYHASVALEIDETPAEIVTALVAAFNADPLAPATAAVDGSVTSKMNLTYNVKGVFGNFVRTGVLLPAGIATTATVVALTGGSGDLVIDEDQYKDVNYHEVIVPMTPTDDQGAALIAGENYMIAAQQGRGAIQILPMQDTVANACTRAHAMNRFDVMLLHRKAGVNLMPPHEYAAYIGAIVASEADSAAPFINEPLPEDFVVYDLIAAVPPTATEIEVMIKAGVTPCRFSYETLATEIPIMVSTATTTSKGAATYNLASISKFFGLRYTRDAILNMFKTLWPTRSSRKMLAQTPGEVKGAVLSVLNDLAASDVAILSQDYLDIHKADMQSIIDPANVEFVSLSAMVPVLPAIRGANVALYLTTPGA